MKKIILIVFGSVLLTACSSPTVDRVVASSTPSTSTFYVTCPDGSQVDAHDTTQICPTPTPPDPVVPSETPTEGGFSTSPFGTTGSFTQDDTVFLVTISKPVKAKCQYSSIGCDKPQTGDRVITVTATIRNTGTSAIEISRSNFVLEFADGTRMDASDGSASDYAPDNSVGYSQKIRPGATYKGTLTFEAPKGAFMVILLTNSYDGDDLHGWS